MPGFAVAREPLAPLDDGPQEGGNLAPVPLWDSVKAAVDDARKTRNFNVREMAVDEALWDRHKEIEKRLGRKIDLPHSLTGEADVRRPTGFTKVLDDTVGYFGHPFRESDEKTAQFLGSMGTGSGRSVTDAAYEQMLDQLRKENPKAFEGIETGQELRDRLSKSFLEVRHKADEAAASGTAGYVGNLIGGVAGAMTDPVNIAATIETGGLGAGRPLLARMGIQALANAGVELAEVPERIGEAEAFGGPKYSTGEAVQDVLMAAGGGALFEPVGDAAKFALRPVVKPLAKAGGKAVRATFRTLGEMLSKSGDPEARGIGDKIDQLVADEAAIGPVDGETAQRAKDAIDRGEQPPAPEPERDIDELFAPKEGAVLADPAPAAGGLQADTYHGRPIYKGSFDPLKVDVDAERFQYKAEGDAEGVTSTLRGVERWDSTASGKAILFEEKDTGRIIVADGHQRRGLAKRLAEEGFEDARLDGILFREADGWTAREVRTVAALKNMREGSGTILDAAKVFRDYPAAIKDRSLPISGDFIAQARALAKLDDDAFRAVINKVIPERYGAVIGELAPDRPDLHGDLVQLLKDGEPGSVDDARALVHEGLLDDFIEREGVQQDLFGGGLPRKSTVIARGQIRAAVMRAIRASAKINGFLVKNADAIEAGGNALARTENEARLAVDNAAQNIVSKLSMRAGDIGQAFSDAAAAVTKGELTAANAAKGIVKRLEKAVKAGEKFDELRAERITPEPPSEAAMKDAAEFEPDGKGPADQLEAKPEDELEAELMKEDEEGVAEPGLWDDLPKSGAEEKALKHLAACAPGGG